MIIRISKFKALLGGIVLVAIGVAFALPVILTGIKSDTQLTQAKAATPVTTVTTPKTTPTISGTPTHVTVVGRDISLNVLPGYYNPATQKWTLGPTDAYFATPTSIANNKTGNTYIYGHNRNQVFTRLLNAQVGDIAEVQTSNGYTFTYKLASMRDVDPSDVSVLQASASPTLSLQTCSGAWYQHRRIYTFDFMEVHKTDGSSMTAPSEVPHA